MAAVRNTRQKQLIVSVLRTAGRPLTAGEIYELAKEQQPDIAKSTIYRNVDAMFHRGELTHGLLQNGESFYGLAQIGHEHEHYLICKSCNRMVNLPECPLSEMERQIAQSADFLVTDHTLQIYGYCSRCRHGKAAQPHQHENN